MLKDVMYHVTFESVEIIVLVVVDVFIIQVAIREAEERASPRSST